MRVMLSRLSIRHGEPLNLVADGVHGFDARAFFEAATHLQRFAVHREHVQRRLELVRQMRDKLAARLRGPMLRCHVANDQQSRRFAPSSLPRPAAAKRAASRSCPDSSTA